MRIGTKELRRMGAAQLYRLPQIGVSPDVVWVLAGGTKYRWRLARCE